uniref:Uncharacterized protein n=1 Tax=Avena sativa TaxID=4498 RepID=A0ACD5YBS1_AVESA
MDSADMLNVRFHFDGEFVHIGPQLEYVGGGEGMSVIERNKLSFREIKGHLTDHTDVKKSMKYYFLIPGRPMSEGLVLLYDDNSCIKIFEHINDGGVVDLYVEYHGEEENHSSDESASNFEDEIGSGSDPDVITADDTTQISHDVVTCSSQVFNPGSQCGTQNIVQKVSVSTGAVEAQGSEVGHSNISDSESEDSDYVPIDLTDDSGEDDEAIDLRKHARQYRKKIRDSQRWVEGDSSGPVPIELVANVEELVEQQNMEEEFDSGSEDYSYDDATDEEDGHIVRRKTKFTKYDPNTEIPHFSLGMCNAYSSIHASFTSRLSSTTSSQRLITMLRLAARNEGQRASKRRPLPFTFHRLYGSGRPPHRLSFRRLPAPPASSSSRHYSRPGRPALLSSIPPLLGGSGLTPFSSPPASFMAPPISSSLPPLVVA